MPTDLAGLGMPFILLCSGIFVLVSLLTPPDEEKGRLVWTDLGGHRPGTLRSILLGLFVSIAVFAVLGFLMHAGILSSLICALLGSIWTWGVFFCAVRYWPVISEDKKPVPAWLDDRSWAGLLCGLAIFMMYYFY